jgi:streptogramin lyase
MRPAASKRHLLVAGSRNGSGGSTPDAIVIGPDGNLWLTEVAGNKIGWITPEGEITEFEVQLRP